MTTDFMKRRSHLSGFGKTDINKNRTPQGGSGGGGGSFGAVVVGRYDSWYPTSSPVWVSLCPSQAWDYELYNKENREVEKAHTAYFAFEQHTVGATKRRFQCSAGAHLDSKCYGCSERAKHYKRVREIEDATGSIPTDMQWAPVSKMRQFALSMTILEEMGEFPKLDRKTGEPVMSRRGKAITEFIPMRNAARMGRKAPPRAKVFGKRYHWNFGTKALASLGAENSILETKCATCANDLVATMAFCQNPDCGDVHPVWMENYPSGMTSELLLEDKDAPYDCPSCGHTGELGYVYDCTCGNPVPGDLFKFELYLGSVSAEDHSPKVFKVRPRQDYSKIEGHNTLINEPLELDKIYAPDKLPDQVGLFDASRKKLLTDDAHLRRDDDRQESFGVTPDDASDEASELDFDA